MSPAECDGCDEETDIDELHTDEYDSGQYCHACLEELAIEEIFAANLVDVPEEGGSR